MRRALRVFDPLYGRFELPALLEPFLASPEFRRLSEVRLLNYESLELAALSEVRRRSHTLGVLHLATRLTLLDFGPEDMRAFLCAAVLHDIGTPPFGHTVEYEYIRRSDGNHEEITARLLDFQHHDLGPDHQIHAGQAVQLPQLIRGMDVGVTIRAILENRHPLSTLLFGDLDLDNVDNVYRMSWYLGIRCDPADAVRLISAIDVDRSGRKFLSYQHRPLVERWLELRTQAYETLLNSPLHRCNQAIFSRIIFEAMENSENHGPAISTSDWFLTDEKLVGRLRKMKRLSHLFADLDRADPLPEVGIEFETRKRIERRDLMRHRDALQTALKGVTPRTVYLTFLPYGETLSRRISFTDRGSGEDWTIGSPKLTYRVTAHIGSTSDAESLPETKAKSKNAVLRKIEQYAAGQGWIAEVIRRPAPIAGGLLEF